ncbi:DUF1428 domain-containing protein [Roseomonas fluvialis]|uniref:DUF1428 domain-containing protein n=1 Tax=Roseomonas fluvialis TaxID=1750527 RepID=A0ABM7Y1K2_9PROT|nr:DUF1428 domain-containing protein [Roseomonas fluvialis]BDG71687.1 hypothetical protein Rmf_16160 [Roseomonas fluvialis]
MTYIDGFVLAVPDAKREEYRRHAEEIAPVLKAHGALSLVECWGDDVPEGKLTSFRMAVQQAEDETVVFSWVTWPSKAARDAGWQAIMADPRRMDPATAPFDAKRMIYGGFTVLMQA